MDFLERSQAYVPAVLQEWAAQTQGRAPWKDMPLDDRAGELAAVTAALLAEVWCREAGGGPHDPAALEEAARGHGAFRRKQGTAQGRAVLADDYEALRRALRSTLRTSGIPVERMAGVLYEALVALRLSSRASALQFSETPPPVPPGLGPEQRRSRPEES